MKKEGESLGAELESSLSSSLTLWTFIFATNFFKVFPSVIYVFVLLLLLSHASRLTRTGAHIKTLPSSVFCEFVPCPAPLDKNQVEPGI